MTETARSCEWVLARFTSGQSDLTGRATYIKGDQYIRDMKNTAYVENLSLSGCELIQVHSLADTLRRILLYLLLLSPKGLSSTFLRCSAGSLS